MQEIEEQQTIEEQQAEEQLQTSEEVKRSLIDFATMLVGNYNVVEKDLVKDTPELVHKSESLVDELLSRVLSFRETVKPLEYSRETAKQAFELASNIKLDELDPKKSYVITITVDADTAAVEATETLLSMMSRVNSAFAHLNIKLGTIIQVTSQGVTYEIEEKAE